MQQRLRKPPSLLKFVLRERILFCFVFVLLGLWLGAYLLYFNSFYALSTDTKPHSKKPIENTNSNSKEPTTKFVSRDIDINTEKKRAAVREAFLHTWNGYVAYAWGADELHPVTNSPGGGWGGLGATIIDSLDTMLIMDLDEPFQKARAWVQNLEFNRSYDASTFETTIRYLGGLLAAYELSSDILFLDKALQLANRLLPAFDSPSGIPYSTVNLNTGKAWSPSWSGGASFLSEFGTLQLEFRYLSYKSGNLEFAQKVNKINDIMFNTNVSSFDGLFPTDFHPDRNAFTSEHITFGARGDSFYEYLLKQYLQTHNSEQKLWQMYTRAMEGMKKNLLSFSTPSNLTYIAEKMGQNKVDKMDHLVCFVPGMLALDGIAGHIDIARDIMYTCWQFYERNPSGLAPEIAGFSQGQDFHNQAAHYLLRPETVESLFVLYRVTGDTKYQEWGWKIFQALERNCKTTSGFSGLRDVGVTDPEKDNKMESFFMAETLKYLYLLFSPKDLISLDEFVFNTEAHPTRKFTINWNK